MLTFSVISPTQIHYTVPCCEEQECDPSASRGQETIALCEGKWQFLFFFGYVLFHFVWFGFVVKGKHHSILFTEKLVDLLQ